MTSVNFPIGDFLIKIKNAALAGRSDVVYRNIGLVRAVAEALKEAGYVSDIKKEGGEIHLKISFKNKKPILMDLKVISKPGLRIYKSVNEIKKFRGPSFYIISTPKGVLLSKKALKLGVGGEVIAEIL